MTEPTPVTKTSADINQERLEEVKDLFPEAFTEGRIDFEKLRAALGDVVDDRPDRYSFTWAGKKDAIRLLQTPTSATLVPDPNESINFQDTRNIFIEGENLEVLKLLYKAYFGRVKMIYIDPPYNTGRDFIYPDDYREPLTPYLRMTGQLDTEGNLLTSNPETAGRRHSAWLNMMYPRLFVARQLLSEDGVIFVSIDDNEVHNLRMLMNEIFGAENFIANVVWQHSIQGKNDVKGFSLHHNHLLVYARTEVFTPSLLERTEEHNTAYSNPDNDPRGRWRSGDVRSPNYRENLRYDLVTPSGKRIPPPENGWRWSKELMEEKIADKEVIFVDDETRIVRKIYLADQEGRVPESIWHGKEVGTTRQANRELKSLFNGESPFDTPKPTALMRRMMQVAGVGSGDIVLDFFAGSASSAHAVLDSNRASEQTSNFIVVQIPEPVDEPEFESIADIGIQRVRRVIDDLVENGGSLKLPEQENPEDLGFRLFKLVPSTFRSWSGTADATPEEYAKEMELFTDPITAGASPEAVLWEVAIKEGYALSSRVHRTQVDNNTIFCIEDEENEQEFYICLDKEVAAGLAHKLGLSKDDLFVCRDIALDDTTAANLALQCRLKTI